MKKFLNLDSPFMIFLSDLTDVVVLNVVFILCCIPVITIGPAFTAMHYVTLKMVKDENGATLKNFFKSFKQNFKQSVIVWIVFLLITLVFVIDFRLLQNMGMEKYKIPAAMVGVIYLFSCFTVMYVFPLLSRFENSLRQTVKNAVFMSILHVLKTVIMAAIYVAPYFLISLHTTMIAVYLLVGISGPAYINSFIWNSIFKKYEPEEKNEEITEDEEFHIADE